MSEEKPITIQITLEGAERRLLKQAQQRRHHSGLPRLSLEQLIKVYMLDGMLQQTFAQKKEARP